MCSFAMMQIVMGIETILRQNYNPFTDPAFLLLFIVVFFFGEILQRIMFICADIQVRLFVRRTIFFNTHKCIYICIEV
jgi:hypothetical protein